MKVISEVTVEAGGVACVFGGGTGSSVDLNIPESVLLKMKDLVKDLPLNNIDMHEPSMGCVDCSGCSGCRGCTGQS